MPKHDGSRESSTGNEVDVPVRSPPAQAILVHPTLDWPQLDRLRNHANELREYHQALSNLGLTLPATAVAVEDSLDGPRLSICVEPIQFPSALSLIAKGDVELAKVVLGECISQVLKVMESFDGPSPIGYDVALNHFKCDLIGGVTYVTDLETARFVYRRSEDGTIDTTNSLRSCFFKPVEIAKYFAAWALGAFYADRAEDPTWLSVGLNPLTHQLISFVAESLGSSRFPYLEMVVKRTFCSIAGVNEVDRRIREVKAAWILETTNSAEQNTRG